MIRRAYIIGVLAAALTFAAVRTSPSYCCRISSFQQYFRELKDAGHSLSTIERFVYSLVLANAQPQPQPAQPGAVLEPHT